MGPEIEIHSPTKDEKSAARAAKNLDKIYLQADPETLITSPQRVFFVRDWFVKKAELITHPSHQSKSWKESRVIYIKRVQYIKRVIYINVTISFQQIWQTISNENCETQANGNFQIQVARFFCRWKIAASQFLYSRFEMIGTYYTCLHVKTEKICYPLIFSVSSSSSSGSLSTSRSLKVEAVRLSSGVTLSFYQFTTLSFQAQLAHQLICASSSSLSFFSTNRCSSGRGGLRWIQWNTFLHMPYGQKCIKLQFFITWLINR